MENNIDQHKRITEVHELSNELYEDLYKVIELFFINCKAKDIDFSNQVSAFHTSVLKITQLLSHFMDAVGVEKTTYLTTEQVEESKEIIKLEKEFEK